MIDVLLLADLHGQYDNIDSFLALNPGMVIIAGDLTDCGPVEPVTDLLEQIDVPCFVVPGNCDDPKILDIIERSDAVNLHGVSIQIGSITLTGIGASNPTPFNTPFELSEEEIDEIVTAAKARMVPNIHNVLVTHAPPFESLDCIGGNYVGSTSLRKHIKSFDLVCTGHIHEQKGIIECDGVTVVNPGMASSGDCAMIHFGEDPGEIEIEMLSV